MPATVSVILCTHNPRADYLSRVLASLRGRTLPAEQWELLLIDNASEQPLAEIRDISWHPRGRHISELGLTLARLRGIQESDGGLLVFVDDDNPRFSGSGHSDLRTVSYFGCVRSGGLGSGVRGSAAVGTSFSLASSRAEEGTVAFITIPEKARLSSR